MNLEKIQPVLPINYDRPIGQRWDATVIGTYTYPGNYNSMGKLYIYPEFLVPGSGDNELSLAALANSIYIAAREHNMSLSAYGHYDPAKFVLSATYVVLRMEELRRTFSMLGRFQFGNRTEGEMFATAMTGQSLSQCLLTLPNDLIKFNFLVTRINKLYVPALEILKRWLPHRCLVYKDDEGERYQYYCYKMANWYHLDVNSSSPTVGQLLCDFLPTQSISLTLNSIEAILAAYENDDDFVNFAVEATKAQMPRISIDYITTEADVAKLPELKIKFDIDDVLSLENAYFIKPVQNNHVQMILNNTISWDIKENTTTGTFSIGKLDSTDNVLPILHPLSCMNALNSGSLVNVTSADRDPLTNRPFFTHARMTNPETLSIWSRYIGACDANPVTPGLTLGATMKAFFTITQTPSAVTGNVLTGPLVTSLTVHSDMILGPIEAYYTQSGGYIGHHTINIAGCYTNSAVDYIDAFAGFKGRTYAYQIGTVAGISAIFPVYHDYDYIVRLQDGTLNLFNSAVIWNNFGLIGSGSSGYDRSDNKKGLGSKSKRKPGKGSDPKSAK